MGVTLLAADERGREAGPIHQVSKSKVIFITVLFVLALATFVFQTEFTSHVYRLGFKEPIVLLFVTHGLWWILWPTQVILVAGMRTFRDVGQQSFRTSYESIQYRRVSDTQEDHDELEGPNKNEYVGIRHMVKYFRKYIIKQIRNVFHTSILIYEAVINNDTSTITCRDLIKKHPRLSNEGVFACAKSAVKTPSLKYIFVRCFIIAFLLTVAGLTWYAAVAMTYAADVTAIYNSSAFSAYAFAIPILNERFSWLKTSSVIIAIAGVFVVAYCGQNNDNEGTSTTYPHRFLGNVVILVGSVVYGYYEVIYKKYVCIPAHLSLLITPRRQLTFANFAMSLLGLYTVVILGICILFLHITGIHRFNFFNYGDNTKEIWYFILGSIVSNLSFSALFLSLMALTGPVLSSVSALLTIFLIGLVEWIFLGNPLTTPQLIGDLFVIVGFVMLTTASWKEISEGNTDDDDYDDESVSAQSFAARHS